ncbi:universal stress protein [Thalassospira xiamenensis]|jgi:nucleotide-binding universal stress UspA family protein|uniref:universal stress protein n=1 Tax=Thalassospira xiamenensis TaxID=220697 RepID=UPI000E99B215|nr:universal stress protein [Thalassospira xiamenensis]HBN50491.1 universal stress protein [Thalassospira sp.]|tara:strand:+ start:1016 stop:1879 length:864 start_codon:yes stop_codon:yes gene_type:complete
MKRILVATDFSERSDRAVRRATLLAKTSGASLSLVHVIDDDQPRRILRAEQQAAEAVLAEQTRSLREIDGLECASRIVLGDPFEGITAAVREDDADLLVIGPHRRQVLRDVFVGTTAERTIRASDRPVLMANGIPAGPHRHILVAVDLSGCSGDAVRAVQNLGLEAKAAVSVVHIFDAPAAGLMVRASSTEDEIQDYLADEEERASGELAAFLQDLDLKPMQRFLKHNESSIAYTICAAAREVSADLIVVGTHGRTGIVKTLLGSVAAETLRSSDRDVMAVPPSRDD